MTDQRRALLTATLQLRDQPPEVTLLRRWLDSWAELGDVVAGLRRQSLDVELRQFPAGWRANLYPTWAAHSTSRGARVGANAMARSPAGSVKGGVG